MAPLTITVAESPERRLALRLRLTAVMLAARANAAAEAGASWAIVDPMHARAVAAMTESARLTGDLRDVALVHCEFVFLDVPCLVCGEYVNPNVPCPLCAVNEQDEAEGF